MPLNLSLKDVIFLHEKSYTLYRMRRSHRTPEQLSQFLRMSLDTRVFTPPSNSNQQVGLRITALDSGRSQIGEMHCAVLSCSVVPDFL